MWYLFWWSHTTSCVLSFEKFKVVKCISKKQIIIGIQWTNSWYTFSWRRWLIKTKKQSQTNHINTNPSLNRKKKKPGISSAELCISVRMKTVFACEECAHKESRGHDFVFPVFLADFCNRILRCFICFLSAPEWRTRKLRLMVKPVS